ncbi:hypothetical protein T4B_2785 [Trichinella pseudospiralis]|uniref:Uncharacterized protein n=1 Tax=Trichinella pseudospiralis TaxID=6337 RepID=A0A0V1IZG1_TRIPS|nr:hypothetical protein T4A_12091 [Trichinella pseudospiralis]KRZ28138.1 hypothetical protein T4B_2785 [Trichinella pseudospiralis]KRZ39086.1 hypothetical protein T4C_5889 [Trichinella pseudospiralis]
MQFYVIQLFYRQKKLKFKIKQTVTDMQVPLSFKFKIQDSVKLRKARTDTTKLHEPGPVV